MNRSQIKQWQRERIYRKVSRFFRLYFYEAGRNLIGGLLFAGFGGGLFIVAGIMQ